MKKLLLLAAAAVALGANAQPTLTQNWKSTANTAMTTTDVRQGVGLNGKIYINNKADQKVYVIGQNGMLDQTLPGGQNCGIGLDQAGHIFVVNSVFPNTWGTDEGTIKVYDPANPEEVTNLGFAEECVAMGRVDYVGFAKGDLTGDGELLLVGGSSTGISKLVVADGEVSEDDSYVATCDGLTYANLVVVKPYMDGNDEKYLYVARNAAPAIIVADGDNFAVEKTMAWENKGASNGADIFELGGKKYVVYPTLPNYTDGFAIACLDDEPSVVIDDKGNKALAALVTKAPEFQANPNGVQANWLNAEVISETEAVIYQYVPGGYCEAYTFALPSEPTGVNDVTAKEAKVSKVYENGQVYIIKGDAKYNVMGAQVK